MICGRCGKAIPTDSKYCPHCGRELQTVAAANTAVQEKRRMTKSVKILMAVGSIAAVCWLLFTVFCFYMANKEKKAAEKVLAIAETVDTVYFHGIPFSKTQIQRLDPTNTCLLILCGDFNEELRVGLGYQYDDICSTKTRDVFRMKDSAKVSGIEDVHLYYTQDGSPDYCSIDFSAHITDADFQDFAASIEDATGKALQWYAAGGFVGTEDLTVGTAYYSIAETKPAFIEIQVNADGTYSANLNFTAEYGGYITYLQYTEDAVSANYEVLRSGAEESREFYFTGQVTEKSEDGIMQTAVVRTADGGCYKLYYVSERGYISAFTEGDTVKVYGRQNREKEETDGACVAVDVDIVALI